MPQKYVSDRRPSNLDEAPEFLNLVQLASALGLSREVIYQLEANDPTFPRRKALPFTTVERWSRAELRQWLTAHAQTEEIGA